LDNNVPAKHTRYAAPNSSGQVFLDLSTSKWSHGSPVSQASFLPIFSLLCLSVLDLGSSVGDTDDCRQCGGDNNTNVDLVLNQIKTI